MRPVDESVICRAQGCMLGQLAGDALGSLVEFCSPAEIALMYPDGIRLHDGGTWSTLAGQPTDDSEMALALARSIVGSGGYDPRLALESYVRWKQSGPFDIGITVRSALSGSFDMESQANGAMMRVSPLGIFGAAYGNGEVAAWAMADAALTHVNPLCAQANALYAMGIAEAVRSGPAPEELYEAMLSWAKGLEAEPELISAMRRAATEPPGDFMESSGWVLVAFQNALHRLLHAGSFEEGVVETVMQGGDTDTNAAICGALLGAVHGVGAVPEEWRTAVLACRPEAGAPGVYRPRPREYWPGDALGLALLLVEAGSDSVTSTTTKQEWS